MPSYAVTVEHQAIHADTLQRTAANGSNRAINRGPDDLEKRNRAVSRFYEDKNIFNQLQTVVEELINVNANWNSYGSESPNSEAIKESKDVLRLLRSHLLVPERVLPSAEGGVTFTFVSETPARGAIEVLNNSEAYVLLYDLQGNSKVNEWPRADRERQNELIEGLRNHLRSQGIASFGE
jgi:hypothetical protein